jgi:hypothetical protein
LPCERNRVTRIIGQSGRETVHRRVVTGHQTVKA